MLLSAATFSMVFGLSFVEHGLYVSNVERRSVDIYTRVKVSTTLISVHFFVLLELTLQSYFIAYVPHRMYSFPWCNADY